MVRVVDKMLSDKNYPPQRTSRHTLYPEFGFSCDFLLYIDTIVCSNGTLHDYSRIP